MLYLNSKRIEQYFSVIRMLIAVAISLVLAFILIVCASDDPLDALANFLIGPLQTVRRMGNIVEMMIPLLFTGVSVSIMYACNQINMGRFGSIPNSV